MSLGTLHSLTKENYFDQRYELIKQLEESGNEKSTIYLDSKNIVSIGVGFNLTIDNVVAQVLQGFGLSDSGPLSSYREGKTEIGLRNAIVALTTGTHTATSLPTIQAKLDALMKEYTTTKTQFKFEAIGSSTYADKIKDTFDALAPTYETTLNEFLRKNGFNDGTADAANGIAQMAYSNERLALISLTYNNPGELLGTNLGNAIRDGNRMRAWYEIRYASNGDKLEGIAKRRYIESELFGLYPSGNQFLNPNGAQQFEGLAQQLIAFFEADAYPTNSHANNLLHMIAYEKQYGHMVSAAQEDVNAIEGLSLIVPSWGKVFKPVSAYLINHYTKNENVKFDGTNYFFDGDVNLGLDKDGVIQALGSAATAKDKNDLLIAVNNEITNVLDGGKGNDFLVGATKDDELRGGDGDDVLIGKGGLDKLAGGSGNDMLVGGAGNDTYIFENTFGTDIIKDSDGSGTISIAGWSGSFKSVQGSDIIFRDAANKFEAIKINNGSTIDLLVTSLTAAAEGNILIKNWQPGHLGISLTIDTTTPTATGAGVVNGNGNANAITLDNLRDANPNLDISAFTALKADGGAGNDIIMGMLQGNDTLLGGDGNDIISGGFTTTLGKDAYNTFQSMAATPGADSIDGGAGNDFIFASAGGSMAHGGADNDILLSTGPAYFQFNNQKELQAEIAIVDVKSIGNPISTHNDCFARKVA